MPPTQEQLKNRELATGNIAQGVPQSVGISDSAIDVSDLQTPATQPLAIQPFEETAIPEIETLPSVTEEFRATIAPIQEAQKEKTGLETRIEELTGTLGQLPSRTAELEKEAGVAQKRTQITDLEGQLQTIIAQQKAIPLQLQREAEGRGITAQGLRPLETARLRTNAIRALGASAILQAAQNNLATALDLVDRQVELEFGTQELELARRREQLDLVREDLTAAQRRRADALDIALDREEQEIAEQKEIRTQVQSMALQAAQAGADALTIRNIQNARSIQDATIIAQQAGVFVPQVEVPSELDVAKLETERARGAKIGLEAQEIQRKLDRVEKEGGVTGISSVTGKAFTTAQSQAGTFALRMETSEAIFGDIDEAEPFSSFTGGFIPDRLKSQKRKEFEQAEKNFVTAVLRRESGAAISPEEFKDARSVYIPQVGDETDVLEQKALARQIVKQGLQNESVGAFDQLKTSIEIPTDEPAPKVGTTSSGIKYEIIED